MKISGPIRRHAARACILCFPFCAVLVLGQSEKAVLRFGPQPGSGLTYSITGQVNVSGKDFFGKDLTLNANSNGLIRLRVMNSVHDTVLAALTSPGIQVRVQSQGKTFSETLKTVESKSLHVVFSPGGKVIEIRNLDALAETNLLNFSIPQILRDYFPSFPARPVEAGDRWRENRPLTLFFQELELKADLTLEYTLTSVSPSPDGRKALISTFYTVRISGSRDLGESKGVFEGRGSGTGYLNFLVDRAFFTEYRLSFQTNAAFVMKKGTERLLEMPFTFSVLADVNLIGGDGL